MYDACELVSVEIKAIIIVHVVEKTLSDESEKNILWYYKL